MTRRKGAVWLPEHSGVNGSALRKIESTTMKLFTVGYGGRVPEELLDLLTTRGVQTVVDIRPCRSPLHLNSLVAPHDTSVTRARQTSCTGTLAHPSGRDGVLTRSSCGRGRPQRGRAGFTQSARYGRARFAAPSCTMRQTTMRRFTTSTAKRRSFQTESAAIAPNGSSGCGQRLSLPRQSMLP